MGRHAKDIDPNDIQENLIAVRRPFFFLFSFAFTLPSDYYFQSPLPPSITGWLPGWADKKILNLLQNNYSSGSPRGSTTSL